MNDDKWKWNITFGQTLKLRFDEDLITKKKSKPGIPCFIYLYFTEIFFIDNSTETNNCI